MMNPAKVPTGRFKMFNGQRVCVCVFVSLKYIDITEFYHSMLIPSLFGLFLLVFTIISPHMNIFVVFFDIFRSGPAPGPSAGSLEPGLAPKKQKNPGQPGRLAAFFFVRKRPARQRGPR